MKTVPLLLRFKRRMPPAEPALRYDETASLNMVEEDGRLIPFVGTTRCADVLKTMRIIGEED